jgi:hypothetical protein
MAEKIARECKLETVTVATTTSTSTSFNMAQKAGGTFHVSAASGTLTLNFYSVPDTNAGTAFLLKDAFNNTVAVTIAQGNCYQLPDALFGCTKVIPVVTSGTATIRVLLKS